MIVVLDNIRSAHNVGAIIRTCDAFGIKEIRLCGITPDQNHPKTQKTSLGAEKNINFVYFESITDALKKLKADNFQIYGLELHPSAKPIGSLRADKNTALVLGNEVSGLSDDSIKLCDELLYIPMKGIKESLNVSVAFGVAAFELTRD